ncbi:uncharacterized protein EV422DRAFT_542230 [Fimicolochytrium jonesii]|uniref:uncharacterized protein n=1 Tax=Fimicolochytrium jonesii TaxID=1396493 RepID=UPI0022FF2795|nr:uncharacterized protein EV422DRAFT_542230 [Fimicolochytrium jonesii]KAI8817275.1 hypothetical protein EV422DRAFT_542230 [Fimicolochytrium jonesii]
MSTHIASVAAPQALNEKAAEVTLSVEEVHLLKKELLARRLRIEISDILSDPLTIAVLLDSPDTDTRFPLLAPLFRTLLLTFPPLAAADGGAEGAWRTIGTFLGIILSRVDSGGTKAHMAKRDMIANTLLDTLAAMLGKAVRTDVEEAEKLDVPVEEGSAPKTKSRTSLTTDTQEPSASDPHFTSIHATTLTPTTTKHLFRTSESFTLTLTSTLNKTRTRTAHRDYASFKHLHKELIRRPNISVPALPTPPTPPYSRVTPETWDQLKQKYTEYLNAAAKVPTSILRDFLNQSDPLPLPPTTHTQTEQRANEILSALSHLQTLLLAPRGLPTLLTTISTAQETTDLPPHIRTTITWWKLCASASIYRTFVAHDRADEHFRRLRHFHKGAPYRSWAAVLRGTNAVAVVKAVGNVVLVRPFGGWCILQSVIISNIDDELAIAQKELTYVKSFLDPDTIARGTHVVDNAPQGGYSEDQTPQVLGPHASLPPTHPHRLAVEKLLELLWSMRRYYQLRAVVADEATVEFARCVLNILYGPLSGVYKASDPASIVRDAAKFIDDLILTLDEMRSQQPAPPAQPVFSTPTSSTAPPPPSATEEGSSSPTTNDAPHPQTLPLQTLLARHEHRLFTHVRNIAQGMHLAPVTIDVAKSQSATPRTKGPKRDVTFSDWFEVLAGFFTGRVGGVVKFADIFTSASTTPSSEKVDMKALKEDLEKLKQRKRRREEKRSRKVRERVRGDVSSTTKTTKTDKSALADVFGDDDDEEEEEDEGEEVASFGVRDVWRTEAGVDPTGLVGDEPRRVEPVGQAGMLQIPGEGTTDGPKRVRSIASFESLGGSETSLSDDPQPTKPNEVDITPSQVIGAGPVPQIGVDDTDPDVAGVEEKIRGLFWDVQSPSSGPLSPPPQQQAMGITPQGLEHGAEGRKRTTVWKDPVATRAIPWLLDGWMRVLRPWLGSVEGVWA